MIPRIGIGSDVHAWSDDPDRELWLAGLHWPDHRGLAGHSDADVVAHVACDALFSAIGNGDLGYHFGVGRPEYDGASGATLLREAVNIVKKDGFEIGNIAIQLIANRPKFGPRRAEANELLSNLCGADVNVTATTTDGLGFTGRGEGAAAIATALVYRPATK